MAIFAQAYAVFFLFSSHFKGLYYPPALLTYRTSLMNLALHHGTHLAEGFWVEHDSPAARRFRYEEC